MSASIHRKRSLRLGPADRRMDPIGLDRDWTTPRGGVPVTRVGRHKRVSPSNGRSASHSPSGIRSWTTTERDRSRLTALARRHGVNSQAVPDRVHAARIPVTHRWSESRREAQKNQADARLLNQNASFPAPLLENLGVGVRFKVVPPALDIVVCGVLIIVIVEAETEQVVGVA